MDFSRHSDVLYRSVPGYLALAQVDGELVEVHGPGADVWDVLACPRETGELIAAVAKRYGLPAESISVDVVRLLRDLEQGGYVTSDA